jgi:hypothetical protein
LQRVASGYGLGKADDLMSGIGYGNIPLVRSWRGTACRCDAFDAGDIESEGLTSQPAALPRVVAASSETTTPSPYVARA